MIKRTISKNTKQNTQGIDNRDEVLFHKEIFSRNIGSEIIRIDDNNRDGFFTIPVESKDWDSIVNKGELVSKFPHQLNHSITYKIELTEDRIIGGIQAPLGIYIADVIKTDGAQDVGINIELKIESLNKEDISDLCVIDIVDCDVPINIDIIEPSIKYCIRVKNASDVTVNGALLSGNDAYHPLSIESSNVKLYSTSLQDGLTFYVKKAFLVFVNSNIESLHSLSIIHKDGIPSNGELDASIHVDSNLYQWMMNYEMVDKDASISIQNSKIFTGFQNILNGTHDKIEDILQRSNDPISYQAEYQNIFQNADSLSIEDTIKKSIEDKIFDLNGMQMGDFIIYQDDEGNIISPLSTIGGDSLSGKYMVVDLMVYGMPISHIYGVPGLRQQILLFVDGAGSFGTLYCLIPHNTELGKLFHVIEDEYMDCPLYFAAPKMIFNTSEYASRNGERKGKLNQVYQYYTLDNERFVNTNPVALNNFGWSRDWKAYKTYTTSDKFDATTRGFLVGVIDKEKRVTLQAKHLYLMCFEVIIGGFQENTTLRSGIMQSDNKTNLSYEVEEICPTEERFTPYRCHFNLLNPEETIELGTAISSNSLWSVPFIEINNSSDFYLLDYAIYDVTDIFDGVEYLLPFFSNQNKKYGDDKKDQYLFGPSNITMYSDENGTSIMSNLVRNPYGETGPAAYLLDNYFLDFRIKAIDPNVILQNQIGFGPSKECVSEDVDEKIKEQSRKIYERHIDSIRINPQFNIVRPFFNVLNYNEKHVIINRPQMKKYYTEGVGFLLEQNKINAVVAWDKGDVGLQKTIEQFVVYPISKFIRENRFKDLPENIQIFIKKNRTLINNLQETEEFYLTVVSYRSLVNALDYNNTSLRYKIIFDRHLKVKEYFVTPHESKSIEWKENLNVDSTWNVQVGNNESLWTLSATSFLEGIDKYHDCYIGFKGFYQNDDDLYPHPQVIDQGQSIFNLFSLDHQSTIIMYNNPNNDWAYPVIDQFDWIFNESNSPILYI